MNQIDEYLDRPYHVSLVYDRADDGIEGWVAEIEEIPGAFGQGSTPDAAVRSAHIALENWIEGALEDGTPIPEPRAEEGYNGRVLVRMPRSLHAALARAARAEGVSINQMAVSAIAGALHWRDRKVSTQHAVTSNRH